MLLADERDEVVEPFRAFSDEDREDVGVVLEQPLQHVARHGLQYRARRDRLALEQAEELPSSTARSPTTASREACVTAPERTPAAASSISATFSSAGRLGSKATIAPRPACTERVATTRAGLDAAPTACSAARITFLLFGRTIASAAASASIAATMSAVDGFID